MFESILIKWVDARTEGEAGAKQNVLVEPAEHRQRTFSSKCLIYGIPNTF